MIDLTDPDVRAEWHRYVRANARARWAYEWDRLTKADVNRIYRERVAA